jgi:hypothetical protein
MDRRLVFVPLEYLVPITGKKYRFSKENIGKSPRVHGVFALFDGDILIYYGRAIADGETIRSQLQKHKEGVDALGTHLATHYAREKTEEAGQREIQLLAEYKVENHALPRCNAGGGRDLAAN